MKHKTKILSFFVASTATLTLTLVPFSEAKASEANYSNSGSVVLNNSKSSLSKADKFIHADQASKKYIFDKEKFIDETNATNKEVSEIESDLQATNYDIQNTKNIRYENGEFVRYLNTEEENDMLKKQGLKTNENTENNSSITTFAAQKGGVTKVTIGKDGGIDIYLSHNFTTTLVQSGVTAAATAIAGLSAGIGAGVAGAFASQLINNYAGKAVPKNGIIMYGKPHGSEKITFATQ